MEPVKSEKLEVNSFKCGLNWFDMGFIKTENDD